MVRAGLVTADPLPESLVQAADLFEQPYPVAVFEIQQIVQAPVEVIGQERDLPPELVDGVTL
jgi:hypothetical protein